MNRFDAAFQRLTREAQRDVLRLLERFEAGGISQRQFEAGVAVAISRSQVRGARLGDVSMAALLGTVPIGLEAGRVDQPRMVRAVRTLLGFDPQTVDVTVSRQARFARLARSEPAAQVQASMQDSMRHNGVERWVRRTDANPCPLCTELADGIARVVSVQMTRHEGCLCYPMPVVSGSPADGRPAKPSGFALANLTSGPNEVGFAG